MALVPDAALAAEIRALRKEPTPDRRTKIRKAGQTLREAPLEGGLDQLLREHERAAVAVLVAGSLIADRWSHTARALAWAYAVMDLYRDDARFPEAVSPSFHPTYLWHFIEPFARLTGEEGGPR